MEKNEFEKVCINCKVCLCYYFDDIVKFKDFEFDKILIDRKSYENIGIYDILYQIAIGSKLLHIKFD